MLEGLGKAVSEKSGDLIMKKLGNLKSSTKASKKRKYQTVKNKLKRLI